MTAQVDWQRWCDRFDRLHNGILRLFHDRGIWRTILAMLETNPRVARGGFGEYWLGSCYTDSMLIGIRRETGVTQARLIAEPGRAAAVTACLFRCGELPGAETAVAVLSGGNIGPRLLASVLASH